MRKILLAVAILLLLALGITALVNGIGIGNLQISSIKQIEENNAKFETDVKALNNKISSEYPETRDNLKESIKMMKEKKQAYLNATNLSSDEELLEALQVESYDIEKLWAKVDNHATDEGVNITLVLNPSSSGIAETKNLNFTVKGTYIGITNFLYSIENDDELNFRIYNFKLLPNSGDILQATFTVNDVRITSNSLREGGTTTSTNTTTNNTTTNNTTENKDKPNDQQQQNS